MRLHLACGRSLQSLNDVLCSIIRKLFQLSVHSPWFGYYVGKWEALSALVWFDSSNAMSVWKICGALSGCANGRTCRSVHEDTYRIIISTSELGNGNWEVRKIWKHVFVFFLTWALQYCPIFSMSLQECCCLHICVYMIICKGLNWPKHYVCTCHWEPEICFQAWTSNEASKLFKLGEKWCSLCKNDSAFEFQRLWTSLQSSPCVPVCESISARGTGIHSHRILSLV